jgi:hypothetical protein
MTTTDFTLIGEVQRERTPRDEEGYVTGTQEVYLDL